MIKSKNPKFFAPHAKRVTIVLIVICLITVLGAMFGVWFFSPEKVARREIEKIAKDYYENYFYDTYFAELAEEERQAEFERYTTRGFAPTYLRQLLNYDNGRHQDSSSKFNYPSYLCDTNSTSVTFIPYAPFAKTDYTMKIEMHCGQQ